MIFLNGDYYIGSFRDEKFNGKGKFHFLNGD